MIACIVFLYGRLVKKLLDVNDVNFTNSLKIFACCYFHGQGCIQESPELTL